jgi:membrane associated rhomboid family serine protease
VVAGGLVALSTSSLRFHLFVLVTGVAAGVTQVAVFYVMGTPVAVLGASGATFALVGYVLTSNALSSAVTSWLQIPFAVVLVAAAFVAAALTIELSPPGSALLAHFVGAVLGLLAGHFRVLHVSRD